VTSFNQKQAEEYLKRPLPDLLEELELSVKVERGTTAWDRILASAQKAVCRDWDWCKRRENPRLNNEIDLITALFGIVAASMHLPHGADAVLVTVILFKYGLNNLCDCV
jgi:hypothetical protein